MTAPTPRPAGTGGPAPSPAVLLLGGRSEIGLAIVHELLRSTPSVVVLAQRPRDDQATRAADEAVRRALLAAGALAVEAVAFDALALDTHERLVTDVFAAHHVSHAVVAFGELGDQDLAWREVARAQRLFTVDATAAVGLGVALVAALGRQDGPRGTLVAVSSVAGVRVRRANFVYGAAKGAMDAVYLNLALAAGPDGPRVLVVRPGAVSSRMIAGNDPVALTVTPQAVGRATFRALRRPWPPGRAQVVHVPGVFGPVLRAALLVPRRWWERLGS